MALTSTFISIKNDLEGPIRRAQGYFKGTYTAATVTSATAPAADATAGASTGGIANSAAVKNVVIGSGVVTITLGWVPQHVRIVNVTSGWEAEWFDGMAAGYYINRVVAGDKTLVNSSPAITVSVDQGTGGSSSQSGGAAPASPGGVIVIPYSGAFTDNDTVVWYAEG